MVRFNGVDLVDNKKLKYALTKIYGVGLSRATEILKNAGLNNIEIRVKELSDKNIINIRKILEKNYQLEGNLHRITNLSIKRLMENGSIRGRRHRTGLPVRGQRTRTNRRTRKYEKKIISR
uniref:Ribosomal protein S13 n=1 Tax=Phaeophyceae sp. TaxID=2249243 RepID=A0A8E5FAP0_9PHAE|nr:ribosomal protein S13 [Phaeophyceae sp.]